MILLAFLSCYVFGGLFSSTSKELLMRRIVRIRDYKIFQISYMECEELQH